MRRRGQGTGRFPPVLVERPPKPPGAVPGQVQQALELVLDLRDRSARRRSERQPHGPQAVGEPRVAGTPRERTRQHLDRPDNRSLVHTGS